MKLFRNLISILLVLVILASSVISFADEEAIIAEQFDLIEDIPEEEAAEDMETDAEEAAEEIEALLQEVEMEDVEDLAEEELIATDLFVGSEVKQFEDFEIQELTINRSFANASGFCLPLNGLKKSSGNSGFIPNRVIPESSNTAAHLSCDYVSSIGDWNVMAIYAGTVYSVRNSLSDSAGRYVIIKHNINGIETYSIYQHLRSISAKVGQTVNAGDIIGVAGQSGTTEYQFAQHLHIAIFSGICDAWAPRLTQYPVNTEHDGPIEYAGTTYYNPERVLNGTCIIGGSSAPTAPSLQFTNVLYPATFRINTSAGWSLGSGTVESNKMLTSIRSQIINSSGTVISDSGVKSISGYSYAIKNLDDYSGNDNGVRFSFIKSAGNYTWVLTAKDSGGNTLKLEMPFKAVTSGSTVTATKSQKAMGTGTFVVADVGTYKILKEVTLRKKPYDAAEKGSKLKKGTKVTAVGLVDNGSNYWLELGGDYKGQYIFSGYSNKGVKNGNQYLELTSSNIKTTSSSGWNMPTGNLTKGKIFELKGDFTLNSSMKKVKAEIFQNGKVVASSEGTVSNNAKSYSLYSSPVNMDLKFGQLAAGDTAYTIKIQAQCIYDRGQKTTWVTVKESTFTVGATLKPTSISINQGTSINLALGSTLQLGTTIKPAGATSALTWTSSDKKVVAVTNGIIAGAKIGSATITVKTANGKSAKITVKVYDPKVATSITLKETGTVKLALGSTLQLNATMNPSTATNKVSWATSNKKIAKVDKNGLVTPVKTGTVTITVKTSNGKKDTVKVKVFDPKKPTSITLAESGTLTLKLGNTLQLHASMNPVTAESKLTWSSSNKKIAKVNKNGLVSPVKKGTVTITVKTSNGKKDTVKVKVVK